jgi:hypothetical protein
VVSPGLQHGSQATACSRAVCDWILEASNTDSTAAKAVVEGKWVVIVGGGSLARTLVVRTRLLEPRALLQCSRRVAKSNEGRCG